jgi:hypothetical protein
MAQGDDSDNSGFEQGMSNFYPNTTFLQPPGHVHAMVASSWQPNAVVATINSTASPLQADFWGSHWNNTVTVSAATSDDGKLVVVRLHSNNTASLSMGIDFIGGSTVASVQDAYVLAVGNGGDFMTTVNTAAFPNLVAPHNATIVLGNPNPNPNSNNTPVMLRKGTGPVGASHASLTMPPHSFLTATFLLN